MSVFKNEVGRPSNDILRKRRNIKIMIGMIILIIACGGLFFINKLFNKNDNISGNGKNASTVTITFSNYNTKSPKLGQKVTFKHIITNAKNYYQKWWIYQDGKVVSQSNKCQKAPSEEQDSFSAAPIGSSKYMKVSVYSDSKCSSDKLIISANSNTITWGTSEQEEDNVEISFSGYNPQSPKLGQKVTFTHTATNFVNKYQKWYIYENDKVVSKSNTCEKLTSSSYPESDSISSPNSVDKKKYIKVEIYSDSSCKNLLTSKSSPKITWKTTESEENSNVEISFSGYNPQSPTLGQKVTFTHTATNAVNKYQKWYIYENDKVVSKSKTCEKITSSSYPESDSISSPNSVDKKKYIKVEIYSDSSCKNLLASKSSPEITWKKASTDKKLTDTVKNILSKNNKSWVNRQYSKCSDAGIDENDTSNGAKIACLAFSQVGRSNTNCCSFVKEIYNLAGSSLPSCYISSSSLTQTPKMGYVVQWGVPGDMTHVAIYINESHIINGNWNHKNPHVEDTTKSIALSELGTITGYHN